MRVSPVCEVDRAVQVQPLAPGRHIDRATLAAWQPPSSGLGLVGRMDAIHVDDRLVRIERVAQILVRVDEPLLDRSVDLARRGLRLLPVEADAVHQLDQPGFAIFDAEPAADELPDLDGRRRQNLHRPGAKLVDLEGRQRAGSALEIEQDEFFDSAFVVGLEPDADGRIVNEKDLRHFLELHATIKQDQRVRPAGDAMLLQPIPGDLHQDGPIRRAEEIAIRHHPMIGIDPDDSVKQFSEVRGCPLYNTTIARTFQGSTAKVIGVEGGLPFFWAQPCLSLRCSACGCGCGSQRPERAVP